jgi:histidine kinase
MLGSTDNVLDFLVSAMTRLPTSALALIKLASCFGNCFDIRHVACNEHIEVSQAELDIWQAEKEGKVEKLFLGDILGYVKRMNDFKFYFVHDRIRQAAYSMINPQDLEENHYKIGNN